MMAAPRVYAKMADDGLLPGFLGSRGGAPRMAIIAQVVLAIVIIRVTTLQGLLSYLGLTLSLSAACSVCCLFLARVRETSPWHVSLAPPVFYVACTLLAASIMVYHDPGKLLAAALTFLLGAVVYLVVGRRKRDQPQQQRQHEQVAQ
jgi:amino acid transporter